MYTKETKFVGFKILNGVIIPVYHNHEHEYITIESISKTFKDKQSKEVITVHLNHKWIKL